MRASCPARRSSGEKRNPHPPWICLIKISRLPSGPLHSFFLSDSLLPGRSPAVSPRDALRQSLNRCSLLSIPSTHCRPLFCCPDRIELPSFPPILRRFFSLNRAPKQAIFARSLVDVSSFRLCPATSRPALHITSAPALFFVCPPFPQVPPGKQMVR